MRSASGNFSTLGGDTGDASSTSIFLGVEGAGASAYRHTDWGGLSIKNYGTPNSAVSNVLKREHQANQSWEKQTKAHSVTENNINGLSANANTPIRHYCGRFGSNYLTLSF